MSLDVSSEGFVSNLKYFTEKGAFGTTVDEKGNVYIGDGNIYVCDASGKQIREIKLPERPHSMAFSPDYKILYVTGENSLFGIHID